MGKGNLIWPVHLHTGKWKINVSVHNLEQGKRDYMPTFGFEEFVTKRPNEAVESNLSLC